MKKTSWLLAALILTISLPSLAFGRQVTLSTELADNGDSVVVSINVSDLSDIAGYNIDFTYNSHDLKAVDAALGSDFVGRFFLSNLKTSGTARLTMMGLQGHSSDAGGVLATVKFSVLNKALQNSPLKLTTVKLKNGEGQNIAGVEVSDGTVNGD